MIDDDSRTYPELSTRAALRDRALCVEPLFSRLVESGVAQRGGPCLADRSAVRGPEAIGWTRNRPLGVALVLEITPSEFVSASVAVPATGADTSRSPSHGGTGEIDERSFRHTPPQARVGGHPGPSSARSSGAAPLCPRTACAILSPRAVLPRPARRHIHHRGIGTERTEVSEQERTREIGAVQ